MRIIHVRSYNLLHIISADTYIFVGTRKSTYRDDNWSNHRLASLVETLGEFLVGTDDLIDSNEDKKEKKAQ